ncbi:MAG: DUF4338 domain-containing protein [Deltaproteobacteria bacterium]|nr:DUF4338 domain-containing protein [Deltaproteobacteria bacterium]
MESDFIYQGHKLTHSDITSVKTLINKNTDKSRYFISRELCRQWNWRQLNGALKDMFCRSLLLKLESVGLITLPPPKRITNNPLANRKPPELIKVDQTPIVCNIEDIQPIELRSVRKTQFEKLYNSLIQEHHYLRYTYPIGENLKYIVFSNGRPIACMGWTSAVRHIGCRDRFIGWSPDMRKKNLHLIAYNTRFLILPWVKVTYLASHLLGLSTRIVPVDWLGFYKHPIYFLETFVDTEKFHGTCYRAANWIYLGKTTGRGKNDQTNKQNRSIKAVFGYPLHKNFRRILCH